MAPPWDDALPLHRACYAGDVAAIRKLIAGGWRMDEAVGDCPQAGPIPSDSSQLLPYCCRTAAYCCPTCILAEMNSAPAGSAAEINCDAVVGGTLRQAPQRSGIRPLFVASRAGHLAAVEARLGETAGSTPVAFQGLATFASQHCFARNAWPARSLCPHYIDRAGLVRCGCRH